MTCKENCLNYDMCERGHKRANEPFSEFFMCNNFKDKNRFVEVVHGKWEATEYKEHLNVVCSNCNEDFYVYKKGQYRIDRSNYCPKCGAKMDGERKEDSNA